MNRVHAFVLISVLSAVSLGVARDEVTAYSLTEALGTADAKSKLGDRVKFYFGKQPHGKIAQEFGEFKTNKKTNAFNKSDKEACQWAFLSAMITLKDRALKEGGNAVINIRSNYRNNETSSEETFQCGSGNVVCGVALIGTVVKLADEASAPAAEPAPEKKEKKKAEK